MIICVEIKNAYRYAYIYIYIYIHTHIHTEIQLLLCIHITNYIYAEGENLEGNI